MSRNAIRKRFVDAPRRACASTRMRTRGTDTGITDSLESSIHDHWFTPAQCHVKGRKSVAQRQRAVVLGWCHRRHDKGFGRGREKQQARRAAAPAAGHHGLDGRAVAGSWRSSFIIALSVKGRDPLRQGTQPPQDAHEGPRRCGRARCRLRMRRAGADRGGRSPVGAFPAAL